MSISFNLSSLTPSPGDLSTSSIEDSADESASRELADSFADTLSEKLNHVEATQRDAQEKMRLFAAGEIDNIHDVTVAQQKANMAMRVTGLIREKLMQGFDELKRLQ
ncbi:MAG: flagellar hook-basal body complex protein FliE [bacterium]